MVGFIFGVIIFIVGIGLGIFLAIAKKEDYQEDDYGNYVRDSNGKKIKVTTRPFKKYSWIAFVAGIVLCLFLLFIGCTVSVETGNTGVVTTFGRVENYTLEAGFHLKAPWNSVISMDNRVQKATVQLSCFSSDIQEVEMKYTLNYQIDKANAQEIYKTIGSDYYKTIIEPNISEAAKVITAKYTAEQLVQTRTDLATGIEAVLTEALASYNIKVSSTAIEDLDFTDSFTNAVEAKQVAEQKKKQAIIEQEQARLEAENAKAIAKTQAEAAAEVARIQAEADLAVQQINADAAEYTGRKEAMATLYALAGVNGWAVVIDDTGSGKLYKADGSSISAEELKVGTENLIKYYYTQNWNGILPETYVGNDNVSSILVGNTNK